MLKRNFLLMSMVFERKCFNANFLTYCTFDKRCHITQETVQGHVDALIALRAPLIV